MAVSELLKIIVLAFAATGFGALSRALPWPKKLSKRKPWACAACWGGWSSLFVYGCAIVTELYKWDGFAYFCLDWMVMTGISAWMLSMTGMFASLSLEDL